MWEGAWGVEAFAQAMHPVISYFRIRDKLQERNVTQGDYGMMKDFGRIPDAPDAVKTVEPAATPC
jgi:hypothetical protein